MNQLRNLFNNGVELCQDDKQGRYLITTRSRSPGDELLRCTSAAAVVHDQCVALYCHHCLNRLEMALQCGGCSFALFCSQKCTNEALKYHPLECSFLAADRHCTELRLLYRILLLNQQDSLKESYDNVLKLVSHVGDYDPESLEMYSSLVQSIRPFVSEWPGDEHVLQLFLRIMCNAHSITTPSKQVLGLGLYPSASMANHSCSPNAHLSFQTVTHQPPGIVFHSLTSLNPSDPIEYAYIDLYQSQSSRQKYLQERYHFMCSCKRCIINDDEFVCATIDTEDMLVGNFLENPDLFNSKLSIILEEDTEQDILDGLLDFDDMLSEYLSPSHYLRVNVCFTFVRQCTGEHSRLNDIISRLISILEDERFSVCNNQPELAELYERMGALGLEDSLQWYTKALNVRRICFGSENQITRQTQAKVNSLVTKKPKKRNKKKNGAKKSCR